MLKNLRIIILTVLAVTLSYHWYDGYGELKRSGSNTAFLQYAKEDALVGYKKSVQFIKDLPAMMEDAVRSDDKVKRGSMNRLAEGLEVYKAENDSYPIKLTDLNSDYMNKRTHNLIKEGLGYSVAGDGQHFKLTIELKNGEKYTIER